MEPKLHNEDRPYINLLGITKPQTTYLLKNHTNKKISNLPKARKYKHTLENLLGKTICIKTTKWQHKIMNIHGRKFTRILIMEGTAETCSKKYGLTPAKVQYLSTLLDGEWYNRNKDSFPCQLKMKGFCYMHENKGTRNIGFHTYSAKPIKSETKTEGDP